MMENVRKKSYEVSRDGRIIIYPSLYETKEKGKVRRILKKLIHTKEKTLKL